MTGSLGAAGVDGVPADDPVADGDAADKDDRIIDLMFGENRPVAERYVELLLGDGVEHGLLGPREAPRIWSRHVLNSAVACEAVAVGASVLDVGSGAGLPGIPMAIRRADLTVTLLEPLQRRVEFLGRVIADLGLGSRVSIVRGRADEKVVRATLGRAPVVTARAVAPLGKLATWCAPLLAEDGALVALKGARAGVELARDEGALRRLGLRGSVRTLAAAHVSATVIEVRRTRER